MMVKNRCVLKPFFILTWKREIASFIFGRILILITALNLKVSNVVALSLATFSEIINMLIAAYS